MRDTCVAIRAKLLVDRQWRKSLLAQHAAKHRSVEGWCWLSKLKPTKARGYVQPSINGVKPTTLHVLSALDKYNRFPAAGEDASHLCGNAVCFNADHICL